MSVGMVASIYLRASPENGVAEADAALVEAGKGLVGDRYHAGSGSFWRDGKNGQDLTFIEAEALAALEADTGIVLAPELSRRNILTRGVSLEALLGQPFRVGEVECLGARRCPPCSRLEALTEEGVHEGLIRRGGLRADALTSGRIARGDTITLIESLA